MEAKFMKIMGITSLFFFFFCAEKVYEKMHEANNAGRAS